jgi:prephenate dehydrogenase
MSVWQAPDFAFENVQVGIIGLGDMGALYGRRFAQAGIRY